MTITNMPKKQKWPPKKKMIDKLWPHFPKPSQIKTFQAQYGKTIASWQLAEMTLEDVYRSATCPTRPGAQAAAFFSLQGFKSQLMMTNSAVRFALHDKPDLLAEWGKLSVKADDKSRIRNQIAHGMIHLQFNETKKERKIFVDSVVGDPRNYIRKTKQPNNKPEPMTLKRLKEYEKDFRNLAQSMREFSRRIPPP